MPRSDIRRCLIHLAARLSKNPADAEPAFAQILKHGESAARDAAELRVHLCVQQGRLWAATRRFQ